MSKNLSPIKFHDQPQHQKVKQAQQKLTKSCTKFANFQFDWNQYMSNVVSHSSLTSDLISKESDLDIVMNQFKTKFDSATYQENILVSTLQSASWTTEKTLKFFNTSKHAVLKAINLKKEDEILSVPIRAKRKGISSVDLQEVTKFYNDDEYSRLLCRRKYFVSVRINGEKEHVQNRLLLGNLSEL